MTLTPFTILLWAICAILKASVCVAVIRSGTVRRWPLLFALFTFGTLRTLVLMGLISKAPSAVYFYVSKAHYPAYFHIYWYSKPVDVILTAGVLADTLRNLPGYFQLPRYFRYGSLLAAMGIGVLVFILSLHEPHAVHAPWAEFALRLQRCMSIAWTTFALIMFASPSLLKMGWPRLTLGVAVGFMATSACDSAFSFLMAVEPWKHIDLGSIETVLNIAVLLYLWRITTTTTNSDVNR